MAKFRGHMAVLEFGSAEDGGELHRAMYIGEDLAPPRSKVVQASSVCIDHGGRGSFHEQKTLMDS